MTRKAIGYIRVSTDKQADSGISLEAQQDKIEKYCDLYDFDLVRIESDPGASASSLDREGIQRALKALRTKEIDVLIVTKLDRLTRDISDLDTLLTRYFAEGKNELVSVAEQVDTTTATGRLILNILMSVSQWERGVIAERTSEALQHKISKMEYIGGNVPYGYTLSDDGSMLKPDPEEQCVVSYIYDLREDGEGLSYRAIADQLTSEGIYNREGNPFGHNQIRRIVMSSYHKNYRQAS